MANPKLCGDDGHPGAGAWRDHVLGTDAIWTGSPQWQMEAIVASKFLRTCKAARHSPWDRLMDRSDCHSRRQQCPPVQISGAAEGRTGYDASPSSASYEQDGPDRSNRTDTFVSDAQDQMRIPGNRYCRILIWNVRSTSLAYVLVHPPGSPTPDRYRRGRRPTPVA